jgi:5'-nucleotidase
MEKIIISDEKELEEKIREMAKAGISNLHVISDFDRTLTKAFVNKEKVPSMISVLRSEKYLTPDYSDKAYALFDKYHPIEIDPNVPIQEKKKAMNEWWTRHFELLINSRLNKKDLEKVVKSKKLELRSGVLEFLEVLKKNNLPLVILSSAGLGTDSISLFLEYKKSNYDNIYIISNAIEWDEKGKAIGFKKPVVHSMNKDETLLKEFDFFYKIKERKNVILIGDSLEDLGMIKGFEYDNLIAIGFLNEDVEKNLEFYKKIYDAVILNDGSFDYINGLVKRIIS